MEKSLYLIILVYFALGAIAFAIIGKGKSRIKKREIWTKYVTYFLIIHIIYFGILFSPPWFSILAAIMIVAGLGEITWLNLCQPSSENNRIFLLSLLIFLLFAIPFFLFSLLERSVLLYVFIIVMVFDAFSQISGQLFGGRKLIPSISPQKTLSGLIGGIVAALVTTLFAAELIKENLGSAMFITAIIVIFALIGDLLASFYKRKNGVKDFSNLLPGHGGFLDRFDGFIPAGAVMYVLNILLP